MGPFIKIDLRKIAASNKPVLLDIGCGENKRPGAIGIDKATLPEVDIIADIEGGLKFLPDGFADEVYAFSRLGHIHNAEVTFTKQE
jgi:predicted SAM-dependent methyltransferase